MNLGISQPTFLPWCGYFGLLNYVDEFVILDNVQFQKRSWQQRNQIKILNDKTPAQYKGLKILNNLFYDFINSKHILNNKFIVKS